MQSQVVHALQNSVHGLARRTEAPSQPHCAPFCVVVPNGVQFMLAHESHRASCFPQGLPTVSVQWGAWAGAGMAASDARLAAALASAGMGAITAQQGLAALSSVLSGGLFSVCFP